MLADEEKFDTKDLVGGALSPAYDRINAYLLENGSCGILKDCPKKAMEWYVRSTDDSNKGTSNGLR